MSATTEVIVPLYIYPFEGSWDPLLDAIQRHPETRFTIIINPGSGPGPHPLPDANYLREIPRLRSHFNTRVLGYVHVSYTRRPIKEVIKDVGIYSAWANHKEHHPGVMVDGIFVDETPQQWNEQYADYFRRLHTCVKLRSSGLGKNRTICLNPGCVPAKPYLDLADLIVVFEDRYDVLRERLASGALDLRRMYSPNPDLREVIPIYKYHSARFGFMVHSVSASPAGSKPEEVLAHVKRLGGSIFVTESTAGFYENFSPKWAEWVELISQD